MHTEENPISWARATWAARPLELMLPAAVGVSVAQIATAYFALRSEYHLLLWISLGLVAFAAARTMVFIHRITKEHAWSRVPEVSMGELARLILPLFSSVALYAAIAPNDRLGLFFATMSLPHFFFVIYLAKRYARLAPGFAFEPSSASLKTRAAIVQGYAHIRAVLTLVPAVLRRRLIPHEANNA